MNYILARKFVTCKSHCSLCGHWQGSVCLHHIENYRIHVSTILKTTEYTFLSGLSTGDKLLIQSFTSVKYEFSLKSRTSVLQVQGFLTEITARGSERLGSGKTLSILEFINSLIDLIFLLYPVRYLFSVLATHYKHQILHVLRLNVLAMYLSV